MYAIALASLGRLDKAARPPARAAGDFLAVFYACVVVIKHCNPFNSPHAQLLALEQRT